MLSNITERYFWEGYLGCADAAIEALQWSELELMRVHTDGCTVGMIHERERCSRIVLDMPENPDYQNDICKVMAWDCYHEIKGTHGRACDE